MKLVFFSTVFIVSGLLSVIIIFSDDLSEKLTYNLNRNLNVDWGDNHPKFLKQGLNVDLLDLSVRWDYFNILFPNSETALILNALSNIQSSGCISKISLSLNYKIKIICNEIRTNLKKISGLNIINCTFPVLFSLKTGYLMTFTTNKVILS